MKIHESGTFLDGKYYYVKINLNQNHSGTGKTMIIFPSSKELIFPLRKKAEVQVNKYKYLFSYDSLDTVYILGYDPNVSANIFLNTADDFSQFIKTEIGPSIIMGISYGGNIAIPFAYKYPELTQKLILVVCSYALSDSGVYLCNKIIEFATKGKMLKIEYNTSSLFKNRFLRCLAYIFTFLQWPFKRKHMNSPQTLINAYSHAVKCNYFLKPFINDIEVPTLIIGSTKDQYYSAELYKELANEIKDSLLHLFEGDTHVVPVEKLFKVRMFISHFLKKG